MSAGAGVPDVIVLGDSVCLRRTVSESDVYLFAGITQDFHPNHSDAEYMAAGRYGGRLVHGALIVGLMSGASTQFMTSRPTEVDSVSLGYDAVRFLGPVLIGDTVTVTYRIDEVDRERSRCVAAIEVRTQRDDLVAVGRHITKFVR